MPDPHASRRGPSLRMPDPTSRNTHNTERTEPATYKHCPNMHVVQAGMTASTLAEAGYPGEPDLLDLEPGFFDAQGFRSVRREAITETSETAGGYSTVP